MFIGRKEEQKQLELVYNADHSNMIVVYGREGIGKTSLALNFGENRNMIYFHAVPSSEAEQARMLESHVTNVLSSDMDSSDAAAIKLSKRVVIVDEFQNITSPASLIELMRLTKDEDKYGRIMLILLSSSINWVENAMISDNKEFAKAITGIIKLKELTYAEIVEWFPKLPAKDCVIIRALLGGVPKYLNYWQENRRVRENMLSLFFTPGSVFLTEAEYQLKLELRELNAYNTILTALAMGKYKLNDLFAYTGYTRAKISVYLRNLIEMDLVEKIYSVKVKNIENTQKGLYRIKDNFLNFYYAYIFPNISEIVSGKGRNVYNAIMEQDFDRYMRPNFADVCREYLDLMSRYKRLGFKFGEWKSWYGKSGVIDIVGQDSERHIIAGICCYTSEPAGHESLEELKELITSAGMKTSRLCIFSKNGFKPEFIREAKNEGIMTVSLNDL